MAGVYFSDRALTVLGELHEDVQREVRSSLANAARWPRMYPLVTGRPKWQHHRKIVVRRRWLALYLVVTPPDAADEQIYVTDIVPARSNY